MRRRVILALLGLVSLALPAAAQQPEYHANDVTPPAYATAKLNASSGGKQVGASGNHAILMTGGNSLSSVDLHPGALAYYSAATASDDVSQCGWTYYTTGIHATKWSGTAASIVDLNPSGFNFSYCMGTQNGQQVGFAEQQSYFVTASHAMLWNGSSASAADLHPTTSGYLYSRALGIHDGEQVGYVSSYAYPYGDYINAYHATSHAYRWAGTAASAQDLHPSGYDASEAVATNGLQQGGWAYLALGASHLHAMLWNGSSTDVVDLHPVGYTETRVNAMTLTQQVGDGWVGTPGAAGSIRHALLWNGTADSVVDLNQYLPAGYLHGVATGIDADGNVVGYAYNTLSQGYLVPYDAIAVVFAPGPPPPSTITSLTFATPSVIPGATDDLTVALSANAPAGGVTISFLSTNTTLAASPAAVVIPEGQSTVTVPVQALGLTLTGPTSLKVYASDGTVSRSTVLSVVPVVKLTGFSMNPVEGGFSTSGSITLNIPAQAGGATVTLTSGNTALVTVPAQITLPQGWSALSFAANTTSVSTITAVPVTATFDGATISTTLSLNPAPVVAVSSVGVPALVGGQSVIGTVSVTNFPRAASGAVITLTSSDTKVLQVPATVTMPYGYAGVTFPVTSSVVSKLTTVTVTATYNGSSVTGTVAVNPVPTVTITQADWMTDTHMLKVQADTSYANSILTYGIDGGGPIGTMQFEVGTWKGSMIIDVQPKTVTVWNSNGGSATFNVTAKSPSTGGGGGGGGTSTGGGGTSTGGGGGTTTSSTSKLTVGRSGKGSITSNPAGIACGVGSGGCAASFASGTTVTLTAKPDAGAAWTGWTGACTGTSLTCTVTLNKDTSVTANFK